MVDTDEPGPVAEADVIELGRHAPSVDSVISRLDRYKGEIKSITAIIQWENGTFDVVGNDRPIPAWAYDRLILELHLQGMIHVCPDGGRITG